LAQENLCSSSLSSCSRWRGAARSALDATMPSSIGSFRDGGGVLEKLPQELEALRTSDADFSDFRLEPGHHLNHAAFGAALGVCVDLDAALRRLAERNPSRFYDQLLLPLLRETVMVAMQVFQGPVTLLPNCTLAMKSVLEGQLCDDATASTQARVAYLPPLYGATSTLLQQLFPSRCDEVTVSGAAFCEDADTVIRALTEAYSVRPFAVLVMDHVASLSGRILPVAEVVAWCRTHGIVSIVDGTASAEFELAVFPDYYVLSTHKWLCNVKTCAIVRVEPGARPLRPIAYSFGFPDEPHLWTGMLDYIPYVVLAKALRIYQQHGIALCSRASQILDEGLPHVGARTLVKRCRRTVDLVKVHRFEDDVQSSLEAAGIHVSRKRIGGATYLRVSAWLYNSVEDFKALGDALNYNHPLNVSVSMKCSESQALKRREIHQAFTTTFDMTDSLFSQLSNEAFFTRAERLRHPPIFYFGHTAAFFVNKLILGMYLHIQDRIDPEIESLCAVGVDEMSWDDLWLGNWDKVPPEQHAETVGRVRSFRRRVRELVSRFIFDVERAPLSLPIVADSAFWVILMGIEHERIHTETSSVIFAQMPLHLMRPSPQWPICLDGASKRDDVVSNRLVQVKGGDVCIGRPWAGGRFYGWDNEFGTPSMVTLEDFEVSAMLVSNAEFVEFVEDGGYDKQEFWSPSGWKWCTTPETKRSPLFWVSKETLRTVSREIPMAWDWPVETNNYEAEAFCAWKSTKLGRRVRMISHPEWYLLRERACSQEYNLNLREFCSSCPVNRHGEALGIDGSYVYDIAGNAWQHSVSPLTVLKDFKAHSLYDDFTLPTIDGQHFFLLGGSWISLGNCARLESRYGFRPHFQQFAGIRYVASKNPYEEAPATVISSQPGKVMSEHFLDFTDTLELNMKPVPCGPAHIGAVAAAAVKPEARVLVLQGGPGRLTIELALRMTPAFLLHTDATANFLDALRSGSSGSALRWERVLEGQICVTETFEFPSKWIDRLKSIKLGFKQVNIWNDLPTMSEQFDLVVLDLSVLGHIESKRRGQIPSGLDAVVKPGGKLVLVRPHNKLDPTSICGDFVEEGERDIFAHIARDTRRKLTFAVSEISTWRRGPQAFSPAPRSSELAAVGVESAQESGPFYERPSTVEKYTRFHFGEEHFGMPIFPVRCAELCLQAARGNGTGRKRALEVGCGPGRLALELAASFREVVALDFSQAFIEHLQKRAPANVTPLCGDAHLIDEYREVASGDFNLIVGANVVDRLSDPREWIQRSKRLLAEDGLLVIFSPFTWREDFASPEKWLGGVRRDAEICWSLHTVVAACLPELKLMQPPTHVPFVIPDPDSTYQYTYSQCIVFGRSANGQTSAAAQHVHLGPNAAQVEYMPIPCH